MKQIQYFILAFILMVSCSGSLPTEKECKEIQERLDKIPRYISKSTYTSDSLYIARIIRNCVDSAIGTPYFVNLHKLYPDKIYRDSIGIIIPEIFYSPDTLKMFAFIVTHTPDKYEKGNYVGTPKIEKKMQEFNKQHPWQYEISTFVGFRNKPTDEWFLYEWSQKTYVGLDIYEQTIYYMGRWYLIYGKLKAAYPLEQPHFSINEIGFWNDVIFNKDNYVKGYYDFQIGDHRPMEDIPTGIRDFSSVINGIAYPLDNLGLLLSQRERNTPMSSEMSKRWFSLPYSKNDINNLKKKITPPEITIHR